MPSKALLALEDALVEHLFPRIQIHMHDSFGLCPEGELTVLVRLVSAEGTATWHLGG